MFGEMKWRNGYLEQILRCIIYETIWKSQLNTDCHTKNISIVSVVRQKRAFDIWAKDEALFSFIWLLGQILCACKEKVQKLSWSSCPFLH